MFLCVVSTRFPDILRASVRQAVEGVSSLSRCVLALLGPTLLHETIAPVTGVVLTSQAVVIFLCQTECEVF